MKSDEPKPYPEPAFDESRYINELWDAFYPRLKATIAARVKAIHRPVASDSEIALSAFHSFIRRARDGQFADLNHEDQMWKLLRTIAVRKTHNARNHLRAQKRGGQHKIIGQADWAEHGDTPSHVAGAAARNEMHEEQLAASDMLEYLLSQLPEQRTRDIILLKLDGASLGAIAEFLEISTRTVQRELNRIEAEWQHQLRSL